ncbi:MAG TPA: hypothetical protein VHC22_04775 [Pirellulales bacterium]|nr:hypothetical protein [Pirellulales bacterium]
MLGVVGVISLVVGGFAAGGGAFGWEFLFSDGYREHPWVRSLGRDGARGILMVFGGILALVGFVIQVIDTASKPVPAPIVASNQVEPPDEAGRPPEETDSWNASPNAPEPPTTKNFDDRTGGPAVVPGPTIGKNGPGIGKPSTDDGRMQPPARRGLEPITISNPEVEPQEAQTLIILQYEFQPGHRPVAGTRYFWIIDLESGTIEVEYSPESLEKKGQLTHVVDTPPAGSGFDAPWSTRIDVEANRRRTPVSNRLEISSEGVRSTELGAPATTP